MKYEIVGTVLVKSWKERLLDNQDSMILMKERTIGRTEVLLKSSYLFSIPVGSISKDLDPLWPPVLPRLSIPVSSRCSFSISSFLWDIYFCCTVSTVLLLHILFIIDFAAFSSCPSPDFLFHDVAAVQCISFCSDNKNVKRPKIKAHFSKYQLKFQVKLNSFWTMWSSV